MFAFTCLCTLRIVCLFVCLVCDWAWRRGGAVVAPGFHTKNSMLQWVIVAAKSLFYVSNDQSEKKNNFQKQSLQYSWAQPKPPRKKPWDVFKNPLHRRREVVLCETISSSLTGHLRNNGGKWLILNDQTSD